MISRIPQNSNCYRCSDSCSPEHRILELWIFDTIQQTKGSCESPYGKKFEPNKDKIRKTHEKALCQSKVYPIFTIGFNLGKSTGKMKMSVDFKNEYIIEGSYQINEDLSYKILWTL